MENLNHKALGMLSIFRMPYKISGADRLTVLQAFDSFIHNLPSFFKAIDLGHKSDVNMVPLPIKGNPKYPQRYLLVIKTLSEVLGLELYCKRILDDNETKPIEQIWVIGQTEEIMIFNKAVQYLSIMVNGIYLSAKAKGLLGGTKEYLKNLEVQLYVGVSNQLTRTKLFRANLVAPKALQIRNRKILEFIKNNLKLNYNKLNDPNNPNIENARTQPGVFKPNKLL